LLLLLFLLFSDAAEVLSCQIGLIEWLDDFFLSMLFLRIYKLHDFLTLYANSILVTVVNIVTLFVADIASAAYEKACVLFTIAAMQTQVANVQDMKTDDGLKKAAKMFQVCLESRDISL